MKGSGGRKFHFLIFVAALYPQIYSETIPVKISAPIQSIFDIGHLQVNVQSKLVHCLDNKHGV